MTRTWITAAALLLAAPVQAASVGIVATAESDGEISEATLQSITWHALNHQYGHDTLVLDAEDDLVARLSAEKLPLLYRFHLSWQAESVVFDGGVLTDRAPLIHATEFALVDHSLVAIQSWEITGSPALYRVSATGGGGYVALPEVAVQDTIDAAIRHVSPPIWHTERPDPVRVPVLLAADDEYRANDPDWKANTYQRMARASALLGQAGISLRVVGYQEWTSSAMATDLSLILEELQDVPRDAPNAIRIRFTRQTSLDPHPASSIEDVGRAFNPGFDLVVADQGLPPGHGLPWDIAEEGTAIAHELLHALGAPHLDQPNFLMSGVKKATVHVIAPSSREIARAAAQARHQMWDSVTALDTLSYMAETHIADPGLQLDYVLENLAAGPGVPAPGQVLPHRVNALTNAALGQSYLKLASAMPEHHPVRELVIAHGRAALPAQPDVGNEILASLLGTSASPPPAEQAWVPSGMPCIDDGVGPCPVP